MYLQRKTPFRIILASSIKCNFYCGITFSRYMSAKYVGKLQGFPTNNKIWGITLINTLRTKDTILVHHVFDEGCSPVRVTAGHSFTLEKILVNVFSIYRSETCSVYFKVLCLKLYCKLGNLCDFPANFAVIYLEF